MSFHSLPLVIQWNSLELIRTKIIHRVGQQAWKKVDVALSYSTPHGKLVNKEIKWKEAQTIFEEIFLFSEPYCT